MLDFFCFPSFDLGNHYSHLAHNFGYCFNPVLRDSGIARENISVQADTFRGFTITETMSDSTGAFACFH